MTERELYAHMIELTRRELEEKMCKDDSQPPPPPRRPPRPQSNVKNVGRNPAGSYIYLSGDRWIALNGHGTYQNVRTGETRYVSFLSEIESLVKMPGWTAYAELSQPTELSDVEDEIDNAPTPFLHRRYERQLEQMKSESSYRNKALSPEVVQLQKRLDLENAQNRELARKVDRLQGEVEEYREQLRSRKWDVNFMFSGLSAGMITYVLLHYVFHII